MKKEQPAPIHDLRDTPVPVVKGVSSDTADVLLPQPKPQPPAPDLL
ncbi:MAG: hypothetical protein ACI3VP_01560 [Oscillospiraceae bacterium]